LWQSYPSNQRNMVRKAVRHGLVAAALPAPEGMADFRKLYDATMARLGASPYYSFSHSYFGHLLDGLGDRIVLFAVRDGSRTVASALFLLHGERMHYHLAGSDAAYRHAAPNNLLLHAAAEWGCRNGYRCLLLGGGLTPDPGDSLFRFKAGLSRARLPFHTGRRIHDEAAYAELCRRWRGVAAAAAPPYFLLYRLPTGSS
jgi:lipid II:glycine glycyltransferase (peptidoglycan interpeptide bridge formation enzyme)